MIEKIKRILPETVAQLRRHSRFATAAGVLLAAFLSTWVRRAAIGDYGGVEGGLFVFFLVNFNIILLLLLIFLVGRSCIKLIFDRKRNLLGSRLRTRLVVAFVGLTLIPVCLIFWLANDFLSRAMDGWFSAQMDGSKQAALSIVQSHYRLQKRVTERDFREISGNIRVHAEKLHQPAALEKRLDRLRQEYGLFSLKLVRTSEKNIEVSNPASGIELFEEPPIDQSAVNEALKGEVVTLFEEKDGSKFARTYGVIKAPDGRSAVLVVSNRLSPEIAEAFATLNDSYRSYEQLKMMRTPLRSSHGLTFSLITGMILFAAFWMAFYISKQIVSPIEQLAGGMQRVARGDYGTLLGRSGDDELGYLVQSFNTMMIDLRNTRDEAERRRLLTETIVSNLAVGVLVLDPARRVILSNRYIGRILGKPIEDGGLIDDVLEARVMPVVGAMLSTVERSPDRISTDAELLIQNGERELRVVCTVGKITTSHGAHEATVVLLDDVTELSIAQSTLAWREVARRIAHEIKNPLTPLQLSAQRLHRLFADSELDELVQDLTLTIVEHVDSIKRLANEFSNFARMPSAEFRESDLNQVVSEVALGYLDDSPAITLQLLPDNQLPRVVCDPEQVRRILINLIDNAVAALRDADTKNPRIVVRTRFDKRRKVCFLEVADNGPGIAQGDKTRIFNPYYTTKKSGTGLGLAIVSSAVSDHHGRISVVDNAPRGAKFIVELPVEQHTPVTQRPFGSSEGVEEPAWSQASTATASKKA